MCSKVSVERFLNNGGFLFLTRNNEKDLKGFFEKLKGWWRERNLKKNENWNEEMWGKKE